MSNEEQWVKHLEMVQAAISRLAQNSFAVRGWSVTLVSVMFTVIASKDTPPATALITLVPATVFWGLDAYYLRQERLFRKLYNAIVADAVAGTSTLAVFTMDNTAYVGDTPGWVATLVSRTVLPIPTVLVLIAVTYALFASPHR